MEEYCLERHFKLWEDNNSLLKRVVFLTTIISIALVIKVLIPFVDYSGDKLPVLQKIEALTKEKDSVNEKIQIIEKTEGVLNEVNNFIADQPWQQEKRDLIKRYRQMNASPPAEGYSSRRYQQEADETVRKIGAMLRTNISSPLQGSVDASAARYKDLAWLKSQTGSLNDFIVAWESELIGMEWYSTITQKDETMHTLWNGLNDRLYEFSSAVTKTLENIKQVREAVNLELEVLNNRIASEEDTLEEIEADLQTILPEWLQGLVVTEQVIQLLPVVLLSVAVYVLAIGLILSRHYQTYIHGKQFDSAVTEDPAMSSTWTLIPRGRLGTFQTIMAYVLFFVFAWVMLEKTISLLLEWLSIDASKAWIDSRTPWLVWLWLSRLTFLALLSYVVIMPWRLKHRED